MSSPTEAISVAKEFAFVEQETFDRFERVGYGPLVVQRPSLLQKIISTADPMTSLHISGCKGAGKTTVLNLVGRYLSQQKENEIYFFPTASEFNREKVIKFVKALIKSKRPAYLLVDETQANPTAALFVPLLKNTNKHNITVIGAGVRISRATNWLDGHQFFFTHTADTLPCRSFPFLFNLPNHEGTTI